MSEKILSSTLFETEEITFNEATFESDATSSAFDGEVISPISRPTGPRFGTDALTKIEKEKFTGWGKKAVEFVQEKKYALLSVLGVVLFAAAGFWAATALHGTAMPLGLADLQGGVATTEDGVGTTPTFDNVSLNNTATGTTSTASEFTLKAETGEGVTHLARRAVTQHMEKASLSLSAEQRIYAEDFLKESAGATSLAVGQELTFSAEDVEAAITASQGLSEAQLQNLSKYTQNVRF